MKITIPSPIHHSSSVPVSGFNKYVYIHIKKNNVFRICDVHEELAEIDGPDCVSLVHRARFVQETDDVIQLYLQQIRNLIRI